ncbi:MAG: group II truncated hemoglobin [Deltaproteobacteria bacterium]|nr:group II truncated hemoglobin [Deltaproteobacteria bacterium]MBW2362894.1 group II truncated hemoglobin [Deltaproteobacteria bacterium]
MIPYDELGGEPGVRKLVNRFYDLMDELPEVATIRAMHLADLSKMRERLSLFLCGWLGGPPLHLERYGPSCMNTAHAPFPIDQAAADQWMVCMRQVLQETEIDDEVRDALVEAFTRMADALRNCDD